MTLPVLGVVVLGLLQVPPPDAAAKVSAALASSRRETLGRESTRLRAIAAKLATDDPVAAAEVRKRIVQPPAPDGAIHFLPLPEVVTGPARGMTSVPGGKPPAWQSEVAAARAETAKALFDLAMRAAASTPKHYALADACLRDVIERDPDHPEARRLLGFLPFEGGWATPFAAGLLKAGMTRHPVYGWVNTAWVPHLEKGELPARGGPPGRETWLPAEQADAQRRDYAQGWEISTEHFRIRTNVPLSEAISFGRGLETLDEVYQALFADVIGEALPLARRFKSQTAVGEPATEPHYVSYFSARDEYIAHVRPLQGEGVDESLGIYLRPQKGRSRRGHAYFFRDPNGQLDVTATLHHEVSHQLLFESNIAGPNDYQKNVGNYWVFEGLGTFFETLVPAPGGGVRVGGLIGPRLDEARKSFKNRDALVPLSAFVRYDPVLFNGTSIYKNYQEANALATFLISARDGAYREGFMDYVRDACKGVLRRVTGRSLEDRVNRSFAELEVELVDYLRSADTEK